MLAPAKCAGACFPPSANIVFLVLFVFAKAYVENNISEFNLDLFRSERC